MTVTWQWDGKTHSGTAYALDGNWTSKGQNSDGISIWIYCSSGDGTYIYGEERECLILKYISLDIHKSLGMDEPGTNIN